MPEKPLPNPRAALCRIKRRVTGWLRHLATPAPVPDALWGQALSPYPFMRQMDAPTRARLKRMVEHFLAAKQFTGANGLRVTDAMAIAVAAQACLPLLWLGRARRPESALHWYKDFVGIVLQPGDVVARREAVDAQGLVHTWAEVLMGEAMERGPLMLSWSAVQEAASTTGEGANVVIHEFAHKIDMNGGAADGCPPLRRGILGAPSAASARVRWAALWLSVFETFRDQVIAAERFGAPAPWLNAYGATSPAEFFAVACEAHFVNPERFALEYPQLAACL
ncbi:MAG: zinc-dependent peptidase, partial [Burkholderiaceae bacterium]|nr:zinc-dependent peptidase [Burkholderiaceae bacterium]